MAVLSKLSRYLQSFSPEEWKEFFRWGKLNITHQDTFDFFEVIVSQGPHYQWEDEDLFGKVFPGMPYNNARLRILKTYLTKEIEKFFVHYELKADVFTKERLLISQFWKRGLWKEAMTHTDSCYEEAAEQSGGDIDFALEAYLFDNIRFQQRLARQSQGSPVSYKGIIGRLDQYYSLAKIRLLCLSLSVRTFVLQEDYSDEVADILRWFKLHPHNPSPLSSIYYQLLLLLSENENSEEDSGQKFENYVNLHHQFIQREELVNIFGMMCNFYFGQIDKGNPEAAKKLLATYQQMDNLDLIFGQGTFTLSTVRNIISIGARNGAYEWTTGFLEKAREKLPPEYADDLYFHGLAYLDFERGLYPSVKKNLLKVNFFHAIFKIANDTLLLRTYYELGDSLPFHSLLAAISRYLNRKQGYSAYYIRHVKNFLSTLRILFDLKHNPNTRYTLEKALAKYEKLQPVALRDWLDRKFEEFKR